jgi:exodeoxyribonuclease V alpha subunit
MNWPAPESLPDLSDHQRSQYALAASDCLGILGGKPGTGKTWTLAHILSKIPAGRSAVAAPTGKAAVRITESLQKAGVQNVRATTIHSLLGPGRDDDDNWAFEHNEENPLDLDWIFVDEASMLDTSLAGSLLAARAPGARIMLIGDVNQLAPVGVGAPLRDLIAVGLPYGELTEIRRNSGRIVRCCHGIVDQHRFEPSPKLDLATESPENLLHIEKRDPEQQIETLKAMLEKFRQGATLAVRHDATPTSKVWIEQRRINPVWDTQILVPVNEKSPLARKRLNAILQGFLNPGGDCVAGNPFRLGDKIVCSKNGWLPVDSYAATHRLKGGPWNENKKGQKVYVANGEQAEVMAVAQRLTIARLWMPDRLVRIPRGESNGNQDGEDGGRTGCDWDLAYALSCHKAQGSQWPVVITMADSYPGARMLCTREWWYTGLSRAEILAVTVGERDVIESSIQKSGMGLRKTFLVEEIRELQQQSIVQGWEAALI